MLVKVLKAFPYSADGVHTERVEPGVREIRDDLLVGLEAAGFIGEATADDVAAAVEGEVVILQPVEIPEDWAKLQWFTLKALAERVSGGPVSSKVAAIALIEAELAARADA